MKFGPRFGAFHRLFSYEAFFPEDGLFTAGAALAKSAARLSQNGWAT